jgi:hypothetical protein
MIPRGRYFRTYLPKKEAKARENVQKKKQIAKGNKSVPHPGI